MDQPGLRAARRFDALRGLSRLNWVSNSAGALWSPLAEFAYGLKRPLRVLDLASGGGDVLIRLFHKARRAGLELSFSGCDLSGDAVEHARTQAAAARADIDFFTLDVLAGNLPDDYDVIMTSLFLHHLEQDQAGNLLRWMSQAARRMVLVQDLVRTYPSYFAVWLGCRLFSRSEIVRVDGPLSVRAAFTAAEARALAAQAGLEDAVVSRCYPCRWLLRWNRP